MLAARDVRRRVLAILGIALLVGTIGSVAMATVAGARRSATALARFNDSSRSANVEVEVGLPSAAQLAAFEREIGSPPVGLIKAYGMSPIDRTNVSMAAAADGTYGTVVDRPRVIAGRLANPDAVDEVTISEALAQQVALFHI